MDEATIHAPADQGEIPAARLTEVQRARGYRSDIDGLRSLAILSVVLYHAGVSQTAGGFTGVDVFFVISGYLIGGHINAELASGVFKFSSFYRNRAKRILPALYVVLTTLLVAGTVLFSPRELRDLAMYTISTIGSASNVVLWRTTGYFSPRADQNPLLMTWSLGVEEQFYLVIPVLLVLLARIRHRLILPLILLITLVSFAVACRTTEIHPNAAFYLLDSRAWELGVGVALAMFESERRALPSPRAGLFSEFKGWAGLCLVVAPFFLRFGSIPFPGVGALPSVLGSALLLSSGGTARGTAGGTARGAWVNRRLLSLSPLVFVGRVSYSFYLIHWPVLALLRVVRGGGLPELWGLTAVAASFGLAVLSYYFVEIPFRSSKRAAGPLLVRYGTVSVLLLSVSVALFMAKGLPQRYPPLGPIDDVASTVKNEKHDPCMAHNDDVSPVLLPECSGSLAPGTHIALWGDSHASAVAEAVRAISARQGYFMEEYAKAACPPLSGVGRNFFSDPAPPANCIQFNDAVLRHLAKDPNLKVVVLEGFWGVPLDSKAADSKAADSKAAGPKAAQAGREQLFRSSLQATLRALVASGKQVVVLGETPVFNNDPVWRMRTSYIPVRRKLVELISANAARFDQGEDQAVDETDPDIASQPLLRDTASSVPGVSFWDMRKNLCDAAGLCAYRQGDTPLFVDTNHVSPEGARIALRGWEIPAPAETNPVQSGRPE